MPASVSAEPPLPAVSFLKAVADETRLAIVGLLALTDLRGGEIVARLGLPANAVSYHLKQLRELGLLRDRRSHADARDVYYSLDVDRLAALYRQAGQVLHPGLAHLAEGAGDPACSGARSLRVLFLCTHNSARSQLAEAALRRHGGERVEVFSAGSRPTAVHPLTVALLQDQGIDPGPHAAKSLDRFAGQPFDYVITVCDRMREECPAFPGDPVRAHWSVPDPGMVVDDEQRRDAFRSVWLELNVRVGHLLALPHPAAHRQCGGAA